MELSRKTTLRNLRDVDLLPLSPIERASLLFTLGVLLGTVTHIPILTHIVLVLTIYFACKDWRIAFFFCGYFVYTCYTIIPWETAVPSFITDVSQRFVSYIDTLPYDTEYLTKAFLQGDKTDLTKDTISLFRESGVSHLLALSGLHIGILYMIFDLFLPKKHRIIRYIIVVPAALFFTLMVGAKPSIVRAFLFILIRESSKLFDWRLTLLQVLSIALMIQLTLVPTVITSIGFQLSYCSVLGIALLYPLLDNLYEDTGVLKRVWQAMSISVSCQVFTTPLSWYYFHTFPLHFLIANLIAVPLTSIFMYLSIVVIILSACQICPEFMYTAIDFFGNNLLLESLRIISSL